MSAAIQGEAIEIRLEPEDDATVVSFGDFAFRAALVRDEPAPAAAPENPAARPGDELFAAVERIHRVAILRDAPNAGVARVAAAVLPLCPPDERDALRARLDALLRPAGPPQSVQPAETAAGEPVPDGEEGRRFVRLLEHADLIRTASDANDFDAHLAQLVVVAAKLAQSRPQLLDLLSRIPAASGPPRTVFQTLASGLPSWDVEGVEPPDSILQAMRTIVRLHTDPNDRARSVRELVMAAVERLSAPAVSAAAAMFRLAEEVAREWAIHDSVFDRIRTDALREVLHPRLEPLLNDRSRFPVLRQALSFFPTLGAEALLGQLRGERKDERRMLLRAFLEVWDASARRAVLEALDREIGRDLDVDVAFVHDLLDVLSATARPGDGELRHELEVLSRASAPGQPVDRIARAVALIATARGDSAAQLLKLRLTQFVALPFRNDRFSYEPDELDQILDALIAALAAVATPAALKTAVQHCLRQDPLLGDTRARLRHLAHADLSVDPDAAALLHQAIRAELPARVLGRIVTTSKRQNPAALIEALRATAGEETRALLREVAADYAQTEAGQAATRVLYERSKPARPAGTADHLSGPLDAFGVPRLLASLARSGATGLLSIADAEQVIRARIRLAHGALLHAECGSRTGIPAVYQLLERPQAGSFAFVPREDPAGNGDPLAGIVDEGIRRQEGLRLVLGIVPDGAAFRPSGTRPGPPSGEDDPHLLRRVWLAASSGRTAAEWEPETGVDTWRARRVVAAWVEDGSLERVAPETVAGASSPAV